MTVAELFSWYLIYQLDGMELAATNPSELEEVLIDGFLDSDSSDIADELLGYEDFPIRNKTLLEEQIIGVQAYLKPIMRRQI